MSDHIEIDEDDAEKMLKGMNIPPHPLILQDIAVVYPDIEKVGTIILRDPAVAGAIIKVVNSAAFSLVREIESVQEAVRLLGLDSVLSIVNAVLLKNSFQDTVDMDALEAFWSVSEQDAIASAFLAKELRLCKPELAYMVGLFHDCGIPLLMQKHKQYLNMLHKIYKQDKATYTAVENRLYKTNHTAAGYYLSKSWKLPPTVCKVIKHHHDINVLNEHFSKKKTELGNLLAIQKLSEQITMEYKVLGDSEVNHEWPRIKDDLFDYLNLDDDFETLSEKTMEAVEGSYSN